MDGTGRRRGEQRDHLLDRAEDGAAWVYSSQRVLHRCLCVQHPFVGEEQLLINEKGHRYRWPFSLQLSVMVVRLTGGGPSFLFERGDSASFVVVDVENSVELGELQHVFDLLGQVEQLESGALVFGGGIGAHEFAKA